MIRDNSKRAKQIIFVFWFVILSGFIALISDLLEYKLYKQLSDEDLLTDVTCLNDVRQSIVAIFQTGIYILSIVYFIRWFRRAYANLNRLGLKTRYNDKMAFWGFVIPIASFYIPFLIMKEIWLKTQFFIRDISTRFHPDKSMQVLGLWWGLFLITNYISKIALKSTFGGDSLDSYIQSTQAYIVSNIVDIIAAFVTILFLRQVHNVENELTIAIKNSGATV